MTGWTSTPCTQFASSPSVPLESTRTIEMGWLSFPRRADISPESSRV
ncbi:hypothetical protein ACFQVD_30865 [Streptosporangium amethystogenes subsp. fukuiense]|uniref:Uncharacterized protein n=1 Tax=Streptosporangium amethystogenes subsp. fukuiense TaxID=698418 RepID=A0ABW2T943_9ACTN